jgi:hypothetical protein
LKLPESEKHTGGRRGGKAKIQFQMEVLTEKGQDRYF